MSNVLSVYFIYVVTNDMLCCTVPQVHGVRDEPHRQARAGLLGLVSHILLLFLVYELGERQKPCPVTPALSHLLLEAVHGMEGVLALILKPVCLLCKKEKGARLQ